MARWKKDKIIVILAIDLRNKLYPTFHRCQLGQTQLATRNPNLILFSTFMLVTRLKTCRWFRSLNHRFQLYQKRRNKLIKPIEHIRQACNLLLSIKNLLLKYKIILNNHKCNILWRSTRMRCNYKFKWCNNKCCYYSSNSKSSLKLTRKEVHQHSMLLYQISLHPQIWTQNSLEAILNITRLEGVHNTKVFSFWVNRLQ